MDQDAGLRKQLLAALHGGQAYDTFESIVDEFTAETRGVVPKGAEHSPWQVLEHLRLSLRDLLDYSQNDDGRYYEKNWPEDYWPADPAPPTPESWEKSRQSYLEDRKEFELLVEAGDLFRPFPWAKQHNLLREVQLATDHAAYHLGQLVILRRLV